MNINEATAVNSLLRWVLQVPLPVGLPQVTSNDAQHAAEFLAERAFGALTAGLRAEEVQRLWPLRREPVGDHRAQRERILDELRPPLSGPDRERVMAMLEAADRDLP